MNEKEDGYERHRGKHGDEQGTRDMTQDQAIDRKSQNDTHCGQRNVPHPGVRVSSKGRANDEWSVDDQRLRAAAALGEFQGLFFECTVPQ